ncbi:unnamed protein product [Chironomus riparius]|uniref:Uncharacterized protein n=1 Tax=Chironomus riparius TaxID=315576 RepID=A0A9N9RNY5_9DIPT|nr:unnamed protein product [Chironomus riparius]
MRAIIILLSLASIPVLILCIAITIFHQFYCIDETRIFESTIEDDDNDNAEFYFDFLVKFCIVALFHWNYQVIQNYSNLIAKLLQIRRDLIKIENAATKVQSQLKSYNSDDGNITLETAKSEKVMSVVEIKRIMKKLTMRKSNIAKNKRNLLIRKIHVGIERRSIYITNHHQFHNIRRYHIKEDHEMIKDDANNKDVKVMTNSINQDEENVKGMIKLISTKRRVSNFFIAMGIQLLNEVYNAGCAIVYGCENISQ